MKGMENLESYPPVLLDFASFLQDSKIQRRKIVPHPYGELLARIAMSFNIYELHLPVKAKFLDRFKRKGDKADSYGERMELFLTDWQHLVDETGSPIFYLDSPSDEAIKTLKADLYQFPSDIHIFNVIMSRSRPYRVAVPENPIEQGRRMFGDKEYREKALDRFSKNFV